MVQVTMQLPDQLAAELLPAQRWLPLVLEVSLARLTTPAVATANEIIDFLLLNPTPAEMLGYHVSERAQARCSDCLPWHRLACWTMPSSRNWMSCSASSTF